MKASKPWWCSSASIVLGLFSAGGAASANDAPPPHSAVHHEDLRPAVFAVSVNGEPAGEPVVVLISGSGAIYAPEALIRSWRLEPWQPTMIYDDIPHYPLAGVPGLELHGEVSPEVRMGGVGGSVAVGYLGVLNDSTAVSHSQRGTGGRYEMGFESRTPYISYGGLAELIDEDFVTVASFTSNRLPPRLTVQAYASIPLGFGSLNLSYIDRDERDGRDTQFLTAGTSIGLGGWGALFLSARKSLDGSAADALFASYTLPLGGRTSLSLGGELGQADRMRLSLQRSVPAGAGIGYRAEAQLGRDTRFDGRLTYQTDFGRYDLDVGVVDSRAGVRVGASGGIGLIGDAVFAARRLTDSFATVQVGDYAGVRVYADNQVVGQTDSAGVAIVPRLRAFESNRLRIEIADLPLDAQIDASELAVRPFDRSGVALDFGVRAVRGAMVALHRDSGQPVPAGAWVRIDGSAEPFVVAPGGEAYLSGLGRSTAGVASWEGGACRFEVHYPDTAEVQPRLGPLTCQEITP